MNGLPVEISHNAMARYRISEPAQNDIDEIWDYLAPLNLTAASRLMRKFDELFKRLAGMPKLGEVFCESPTVRTITQKPYVVAHREIDGGVLILRVIHSARDWQSLIDDPAEGDG